MLGGVACIGIGLLLRSKDMHYASLLPGAGIVIMFLSIYGAHNYYHLIDTTFATSGIIAVCLLSLWLNRLFLSELYALFAVVGSYTAPVLLGGTSLFHRRPDRLFRLLERGVLDLLDLGGQAQHLHAGDVSGLVIFDFKWQDAMPDAWVEALVFQTVHFLIFVAAASVFSIRIEPMSQETSIQHIPALVLFYFVQYHILNQHLPGMGTVDRASPARPFCWRVISSRIASLRQEPGRRADCC